MTVKINTNRRKSESENQSFFKTQLEPFLYLFSIIVLPIIVVAGLCFAIFRQFVNVILYLKHKNEYGGLLCSADNVWAVEDISRSINHGGFLVNYKEKSDFYERISELVAKKFDAIPKLTNTREEFLGYYYFLKNKVSAMDCMRKIADTVNNEEDLKDYLSKICNSPLPINSTAMWECHIGSKGIKWRNTEELLYPVIFRFHHTIGDGFALLHLLEKEIFGVEHKKNWTTNGNSKVKQRSFKFDFNRLYHGVLNLTGTLIELLQMILMAPIRVAHICYLRPDDKNDFHGKNLSGEKITVWTSEDVVELVPKCKEVRKFVEGARFSDVICAAIGGSLNSYLKRNDFGIPDYVTSVIPVLMLPAGGENQLVLTNNISMTIMDVPVAVKPFSMLQLLKATAKCSRKMRKLPDAQVNYWLLNYFSGMIPLPLLRIILNNNKMSIAISNLPGGDNLTVFGDNKVEDAALYPPNRGNTGVTFAVSTYNSKFQITLLVDKVLIPSKAEAQLIVDDVLENLKILCHEVKHINSIEKKDL